MKEINREYLRGRNRGSAAWVQFLFVNHCVENLALWTRKRLVPAEPMR